MVKRAKGGTSALVEIDSTRNQPKEIVVTNQGKKLRWTLFGAPGRLVRTARQTIVRLIDDWPTAGVLVGAYQRIALIA